MNDGSEEEVGWYQHPKTRAFARATAEDLTKALNHLKGVCKVSTDPAVRAAHAELAVKEAFLERFQVRAMRSES